MQYWCSMALIGGVYRVCSTGVAWPALIEYQVGVVARAWERCKPLHAINRLVLNLGGVILSYRLN